MKSLILAIGALGVSLFLLNLAGCNKTETGGGDETFKLVSPATSTDVKQGKAQTVRVSIERGAGFKQGVKLEARAPQGLDG